MDSILYSIKKLLGLDPDYDAFDVDVIAHINTALMALSQMGIGPSEGFFITGPTESWTDFSSDKNIAEPSKMYVYIKTKMIFDATASTAVQSALAEQLKEVEWRLYSYAGQY